MIQRREHHGLLLSSLRRPTRNTLKSTDSMSDQETEDRCSNCIYVANHLRLPRRYTLTAEPAGFTTVTRRGVELRLGCP